MAAEPIVFIVDDDPAARDSVGALVKSKGLEVATFASAEEFLAAFRPEQVGCLIVDVRMNGMSGLDLQQALAARDIRLPLIVITGFGDIPTAVQAMKGGALTFLEKPCRAPELWAAVQNALSDSVQQTSEQQRLTDIQARLDSLTADERQVMRLIIAGKTNKTIAAELDQGLRTVELRRSKIMKKMRAESFADLVKLIVAAEENGGTTAGESPA